MNIWGEVDEDLRLGAIDDFAIKIITSGYSLEQARRIILGGIRGYEAKVLRRKVGNTPLYRTAEESGASRTKKKILGKSTWFKGGKGAVQLLRMGGNLLVGR